MDFSSKLNEEENEKKRKLEEEKRKRNLERYCRVFPICNEEKNKSVFPSNEVVTAKYSNILMLYKPLLGAFKRIPILYFWFMVLLEAIPGVSPYGPIPTYIALLFVFLLVIVREVFEDIGRYKTDLKLNTTFVSKYSQGKWKKVNWKDVYVGDIIRIRENETIPADCLCLATANYDRSFYLGASLLNGRTTLLQGQALDVTSRMIGNGEIIRLVGEAEVNQMSPYLSDWDGMLLIGETDDIEFNHINLLPRGAILRNTSWVIGVAAFTGKDCKIFMNPFVPKTKRSKVESLVDLMVIFIVATHFILGIIISVLAGVWAKENESYRDFFGNKGSEVIVGLKAIISTIILGDKMVPMVLILSLEMIRMTLGIFVNSDELMYDQVNSTYPKVLSSQIVEELGQVKYIVSDKTGTLTSGKFQFKLMMVGEIIYGDPSCLSEAIVSKLNNPYEKYTEQNQPDIQYTFHDDRLLRLWENQLEYNSEIDFKLNDRDSGRVLLNVKSQLDLIKETLSFMAICNNCEVWRDQFTEQTSYKGIYQDEVALVDAAKKLGVELLESGSFFKRLNVAGKEEYIEVLKNVRFNSLRRRSTIIVKYKGLIKLYCKGVPEVIYDLLNPYQNQDVVEANMELVNQANSRGMRTMAYGMRCVSENEYMDFERRIDNTKKIMNLDERETIVGRF